MLLVELLGLRIVHPQLFAPYNAKAMLANNIMDTLQRYRILDSMRLDYGKRKPQMNHFLAELWQWVWIFVIVLLKECLPVLSDCFEQIRQQNCCLKKRKFENYS